MAESLVRSLAVGAVGAVGAGAVVIGSGVTASYSFSQQWPATVPSWVLLGGVCAAVLIGVLAGL